MSQKNAEWLTLTQNWCCEVNGVMRRLSKNWFATINAWYTH